MGRVLIACERSGVDRAKKRSETFPGLARAMASQWGALLPETPASASA